MGQDGKAQFSGALAVTAALVMFALCVVLRFTVQSSEILRAIVLAISLALICFAFGVYRKRIRSVVGWSLLIAGLSTIALTDIWFGLNIARVCLYDSAIVGKQPFEYWFSVVINFQDVLQWCVLAAIVAFTIALAVLPFSLRRRSAQRS